MLVLGWCVAYTYKISTNSSSYIIGYHFQCVNPNFQCVSFSEGPEEVVIAIEVLFPTMQESTSDTYIVKCKIVVVGLPRSSTMGEQFGQRRPPLSVTIKQILERYPDGQIFKVELRDCSMATTTIVMCPLA